MHSNSTCCTQVNCSFFRGILGAKLRAALERSTAEPKPSEAPMINHFSNLVTRNTAAAKLWDGDLARKMKKMREKEERGSVDESRAMTKPEPQSDASCEIGRSSVC